MTEIMDLREVLEEFAVHGRVQKDARSLSDTIVIPRPLKIEGCRSDLELQDVREMIIAYFSELFVAANLSANEGGMIFLIPKAEVDDPVHLVAISVTLRTDFLLVSIE